MSLLQVDIQRAGYSSDAILKDVCFSLKTGELVGLIGANGAGKSTTIKSILGIINLLNGKISIKDHHTYAYVPEQPMFYDELTLQEHIDFTASVMSIRDEDLSRRTEHLLRVFKLESVVHDLPNTFSKGMQQKGMLLLAFLIQPDLYIVDEPFIGLDPNATRDFIRFINDEKKRGAGILMSTHVLDTAEKYCDRFLLMKEGTLFADGTLSDLQIKANLPAGSLFDCYNILSRDESDDRL
ncbi:ABC transporter ATP-binding protein [Pseudalkalibacillus sp. SCS-8]|uniref:ABC transporter ATP-binding protein n=1 Tax=Pseudalkalibacillus nanhaiensis TaxID=3115291 RepID=UPI0032DAC577